MRIAPLAILFGGCLVGGCLIVHTYEEPVEDPCPMTPPEPLAAASGPFAVSADAIYYIDTASRLARIERFANMVTTITPEAVDARALAVDGTDAYWITGNGDLFRVALTGDTPTMIASGFGDPFQLVSEGPRLVWAAGDLFTLDKTSGAIATLAEGDTITGVALVDDVAYYVDAQAGVVRAAPPITDVAKAVLPAAIAADDAGIYFYEKRDLFDDNAGRIRHVRLSAGGGESIDPRTTARDLPTVLQLELDPSYVFFSTLTPTEYRIRQVSRLGGDITTLACGSHQGSHPVFIDQDPYDPYNVYFAAGGVLSRLSKQRSDL